jgi:hypothetical protein
MAKKKGNKKKFSSKEEAPSNGRLKSDYMYPRWNWDVEKAVAPSIRFLVFRNNLTTHDVDKEYSTDKMEGSCSGYMVLFISGSYM